MNLSRGDRETIKKKKFTKRWKGAEKEEGKR